MADGLRGSSDVPWAAGWKKWCVAGSWDDITFTIYDVSYYEESKTYHPSSDILLHGDVSVTIDEIADNGCWEVLFGEGWKAFVVKGDNAGGIEDIG